jgi:hypothetical protein
MSAEGAALLNKRKPAYAHAIRFEHDDASLGQVDIHRGEVRDQERDLLFRPTLASAPEEHDGWEPLSAKSEERPEVGIGRDEHALLVRFSSAARSKISSSSAACMP